MCWALQDDQTSSHLGVKTVVDGILRMARRGPALGHDKLGALGFRTYTPDYTKPLLIPFSGSLMPLGKSTHSLGKLWRPGKI